MKRYIYAQLNCILINEDFALLSASFPCSIWIDSLRQRRKQFKTLLLFLSTDFGLFETLSFYIHTLIANFVLSVCVVVQLGPIQFINQFGTHSFYILITDFICNLSVTAEKTLLILDDCSIPGIGKSFKMQLLQKIHACICGVDGKAVFGFPDETVESFFVA